MPRSILGTNNPVGLADPVALYIWFKETTVLSLRINQQDIATVINQEVARRAAVRCGHRHDAMGNKQLARQP